MWISIISLILFSIVGLNGNQLPNYPPYSNCNVGLQNKLNVHLIPHTHDDVGWLKTLDQYYYGVRNDIQRANVAAIIDSVIYELSVDPKRRFIYVETAYLHKWLMEASQESKDLLGQLIAEGRLELIGGGWTMNDEAAAHYISIIDQMTAGHRILSKLYGRNGQVRVGWQIDPFGHSKEQASLFAAMGMDALFFGRLDWRDKTKREMDKTMELIWYTQDSTGGDSALFTGVLPNGYNPPTGFCFDDTCADEPIVDNPSSTEYNAARRVKEFLDQVKKQQVHYATNHLVMTMGSDFQYQNAKVWYRNLDKLIQLVNSGQDEVNVLYSTPSCYLLALNQVSNVTLSTKRDDFFPYASDPHAYWTGYFTSRPAFKGYERSSSSFLQSSAQLSVYSGLIESSAHAQVALLTLKSAVGTAQHHDAITGTEKQHVYPDYVIRLQRGLDACQQLIADSYHVFDGQNLQNSTVDYTFCPNLNVSSCPFTEEKSNNGFFVRLYNPIAQHYNYTARIPIVLTDQRTYQVFHANGALVTSDVMPIPKWIQLLPERQSKATHEIVFTVELPINGYTTYEVRSSEGESNDIGSINTGVYEEVVSSKAGHRPLASDYYNYKRISPDATITMEGNGFLVHVNRTTGRLISVELSDGSSLELEHQFAYYHSMSGDNSHFSRRASGAYIFRPNDTSAAEYELPNNSSNVRYTSGAAHAQVDVHHAEYIAESIKVSKSQNFIEFDALIGPIPVEDGVGKEVISRYCAKNIASNGIFYTDSNGRQWMKRVRDHRDTFELDNDTEPISRNYYPVTNRISIKDSEYMITVVTDRSEGGSSLQDGCIELMVHRRMLYDDAFGVDEALNETDQFDRKGIRVRVVHKLMIGEIAKITVQSKRNALQAAVQPVTTFLSAIDKVNIKELSFLSAALPPNIHLLTLEKWSQQRYLLRLEHLFEAGETEDHYSQPITLNLSQVFNSTHVQLVNAIETTLTGTMLKDTPKLHWNTVDNGPQANLRLRSTLFNTRKDRIKHQLRRYNRYRDTYSRLSDKQRAYVDDILSQKDDDKRMDDQLESMLSKMNITINPMEIRTFLVRFQKK